MHKDDSVVLGTVPDASLFYFRVLALQFHPAAVVAFNGTFVIDFSLLCKP